MSIVYQLNIDAERRIDIGLISTVAIDNSAYFGYKRRLQAAETWDRPV
jgi:hypothetical protein